jgi:hypothetical protein
MDEIEPIDGGRRRARSTACSASARRSMARADVIFVALRGPWWYRVAMALRFLPTLDESSLSEIRGGAEVAAAFLSKKGYDYYQAQSDMNAAAASNNPYFVENTHQGEMPAT